MKAQGPVSLLQSGEGYAGQKVSLAQGYLLGGRKQGKVQEGSERLTKPQQA